MGTLQSAARDMPWPRVLVAHAACALVLFWAQRGAWWASSDVRLAPLFALAWCAMALEPWPSRSREPGDDIGPPSASRARIALVATLSIVAWIPLHAAALVHDTRHGALSALQVAAPVVVAWLAWLAAGLAPLAARGRAWHRVAAAITLALPLLDVSVALGGAPETGGASEWLRALSGCSLLHASCALASGSEARSTLVASLLCAGLFVARQWRASAARAAEATA